MSIRTIFQVLCFSLDTHILSLELQVLGFETQVPDLETWVPDLGLETQDVINIIGTTF